VDSIIRLVFVHWEVGYRVEGKLAQQSALWTINNIEHGSQHMMMCEDTLQASPFMYEDAGTYDWYAAPALKRVLLQGRASR
jgi:hypothetical protein